jgi:hypothetical protein
MGSTFRKQFRRAGVPSLLREFGEPALYYPLGTGSGRSISVIVERTEEIVEGRVAQVVRCKAIDSCSAGISATEINDGRDEIAIALTEGGSLERRQIAKMEDDSNGFVRFRVR